jgi:hypothetical protein
MPNKYEVRLHDHDALIVEADGVSEEDSLVVFRDGEGIVAAFPTRNVLGFNRIVGGDV